MQTINDLTEDLKKLYQEAREGKIDHKEVKDLANVAGKLLKSAGLKLEYNKYIGDDSTIDFLETRP